MIFSHNSSYPIGLDISDLSLKFIQLYGKKDKPKIQAIGAIQLKPGIIQNGEIKNFQSLLSSLSELLSKPKYGSITGTKVVACLPETKTFIKLIKVNKTPNNINDIISSEIEKYIPISINDIYYDWQIISESPEEYDVLIGASSKNTVDQYIRALNEVNLTVCALEIESTAICRALLAEEKIGFTSDLSQNYALVDIGAKRTSLIIYSNKTIVLSISLPISGEEITDEIAKALEINREQAEKAKIICGLDKTKAQGIVYKILSGVLEKLNTRIIDSLDFYNSHYAYLKKIDKIVLCGGGANIKDIGSTMSEAIKIPAIEGNPFVNLGESKETFTSHFSETHNLKLMLSKGKKTEDISFKQDSTSSYVTAIGLALRNVFIDTN